VAGKNKFWSIKNQGSEAVDIYIYQEIGSGNWWEEGIDANYLCREIAALSAREINVRINCPGGNVFGGHAIYNALKRHPARVTTYNDSYAASIASVIFMAGDRRVVAANSLTMIHLPTLDFDGNAEAHRKAADVLDAVRDTIVAVYLEGCTLAESEIVAAMEAETYYGAEEALAAGFATEIGEDLKLAACAPANPMALGYHRAFQDRSAAQPAALMAIPGCHDSAVMYAQMPCNQCDHSTGCSNPNCTEEDPDDEPDDVQNAAPVAPQNTNSIVTEAQASSTTAPQAATREVEVMSEETAPVIGARDFSKEAVDIVNMCATSGCSNKAAEFIQARMTPGDAGLKILDLMHSGAIHAPAAEAPPIVDLGRDASNYSYSRAIGLMAKQQLDKQKPSGLEWEVHQDLSKMNSANYMDRGGILVPHKLRNTALTSTGTNTGKETVFQEYGEFIDILRNLMVCTRMGARVLTGLKGPVNFPKQTGGSSVYWTGENPGTDVTQSNVTFGTVTLSPKTCQAQGAVSRQLITESTPDTEGIMRNDLAMVHALGWDLAGLHGTGANNQPTGLYNLAGVNVKAMGGVPTYGKLVDMITKVATYNALLGNTGWVTNPQMAGLLMQTLDFPTSAAGRPIWSGKHIDGVLAGYAAMASNQVSASLGAGAEVGMLFGNWDDLLIGMWGALELLVDPYTLAGQGLIKITSFQMIDIAARRGESFSKSTGATLV
jgi:HK97 family phage major capsid protein